MIKITLSNNLIAENCPAKVIEACKKALTIENPAYHRVLRIAGPYAAQRDFKYYKLDKTDPSKICVPRGFYSRFVAYLDKNGYEYEMTPDFVYKEAGESPTVSWPAITLRDYQEPLLTAMLAKSEGVLNAGTGAGKTVVTCALARALGKTMTILVPTTIIAQQFEAEFKKWFGYQIGFIGDGRCEIKDITVCLWQSLGVEKEITAKLAARTTVLVVDECHGIVSDERRKILECFKPSRLYGLSGSPLRSKDDGRTEAIFFYLGQIIAEYAMTQIKPTVDVVRTQENIPIRINYAEMIDDLVANESRNKLIVGLAAAEAMQGKKVLILLKRVEHCRIIKEALPDWGDMVYHADGDDKDRNEVLMKMRSGERDFRILIGTVSLLSTGTDIPSLDRLIIGGDMKSDVLTVQSCGRILRLFSGKEDALIYDLFDNKNEILKRQAYERFKVYRAKGWEIKGLEWK